MSGAVKDPIKKGIECLGTKEGGRLSCGKKHGQRYRDWWELEQLVGAQLEHKPDNSGMFLFERVQTLGKAGELTEDLKVRLHIY